MILRRWVTVATCMVALTGFAIAQPEGEGEQGNRQQENSQAEKTESSPTQPLIGGPSIQAQATNQGPVKTEIYQPDCGKPKSQPEADLCTQWRVADAAEKALQYTLAQTIIGAIGVAFVVVTLGFTARANKAAAIAAQAAVDAVGAERAWVSFDTFGIAEAHGRINGIPYPNIVQLYLSFVNTGRSPAIKTLLYRDAQVTAIDGPMTAFEYVPRGDPGTVVGPQAKIQCFPYSVGGTDLEQFLAGRTYIDFYSRVSYETTTAPGLVRYTETAGRFHCNGQVQERDGTIRPNITFLPTGPQQTST